MLDHGENDTPCWYVIHTKPKQEDRADFNLKAWNVKTFAPKIKEPRRDASTGKLTYQVQHLFPRYIFAQFRASELLHKVCFTRGVHSVVNFGGDPCPVADDIIELLQSRRSEDGFIHLGEELRHGDRVIINRGNLKNFAGVLEEKVDDQGRVTILLTAVSYQGRIVIEQDWVRKIG
jgi:transcriptional antiterminator RfaH